MYKAIIRDLFIDWYPILKYIWCACPCDDIWYREKVKKEMKI